MFKVGDVINLKSDPNNDRVLGTILSINYPQNTAEIDWNFPNSELKSYIMERYPLEFVCINEKRTNRFKNQKTINEFLEIDDSES